MNKGGHNMEAKFSEKMKWLYAFVLLILTLAWAAYTVETVRACLTMPTPAAVIESSGTSVLLGALLTLNVNVNQYYFRKKTPDEPEVK